MSSGTPLDAAKISMAHASQFRRKDIVIALQLTQVATLGVVDIGATCQIGKPGDWLVERAGRRVILSDAEFYAVFAPHIEIERVDHAINKPRSPEHREP